MKCMMLLAETANMLIITLAHARFSNDMSLLDTYVSGHPEGLDV